MKKIYILLCLIFSLTFILPTFTGCGSQEETEIFPNMPTPQWDLFYYVKAENAMKMPEFHTNLSNEEHLNNIQELAEKEYPTAERIYVDLLYNHKNEPQFFLVEYNQSAMIGIIIDDKYYVKDHPGYSEVRDYYYNSKWYGDASDCGYAISPLVEANAVDCKKYYFTYEKGDGGEVYFERDGMMHHFVENKKYIFGSEEDYISMTSYTKEEFFEKAEDYYERALLLATAKFDVKVNGQTYGYAKDVNDLKQLGV